ncbi:hypothetical protein [Streptomyces sp. NBC_00454]|uniref:hypothetical protein n=1 Tax=Streptomyces sp. NBC_00454 TaxID=2975747 RepID=UPI0030E58AA4
MSYQPYPPPYQHPHAPVRRWWQHPALIITLLVVIPPVGIALVWLSQWDQKKKIIATVLAGLWFLAPLLASDPPKKSADDAKPQSAVTVQATPSASASPTPVPTPSADPLMPVVVGKPFGEAEKAVEDLVDTELAVLSAYADVEVPAAHADWVVCFQGPEGGAKLVARTASTSVHLVAPGTACPAGKGTALHPKPTPTPTPTPTQDDDTGTGGTSSSTGGTSSSGGSSTGGSSGTVRTPGAFCSPAGATGVSKTGKALVCGPASDGKNRWHS